MKNKTLFGHSAAAVTILIWGTTFISTKVLLRTLTPVEILFIRFTIGYAALWCACPRRLKHVTKQQEWYFAAAGLCGVTLYYLLENIALTFTLASNVGVIISIAPFFTFLFSRLLLREGRATLRFFAGLLIAMAGIAMISFGNKAALEVNPVGDFLAVLAAAVWALYSTITKKISGFGYPTVPATRRTFFYGLLFMIPALCFMDFHMELSKLLNVTAALNLLFLGLGASALCFVSWNYAVKRLGSVKTSVYIYMVPVITAATSALVLHEPMTLATVAGILLTLIGLILSEYKKIEKGQKLSGTENG